MIFVAAIIDDQRDAGLASSGGIEIAVVVQVAEGSPLRTDVGAIRGLLEIPRAAGWIFRGLRSRQRCPFRRPREQVLVTIVVEVERAEPLRLSVAEQNRLFLPQIA